MGSVVDLNSKRKEIQPDLSLIKYVCGNCGGDTWILCSDGSVECSECEHVSNEITLNINFDN